MLLYYKTFRMNLSTLIFSKKTKIFHLHKIENENVLKSCNFDLKKVFFSPRLQHFHTLCTSSFRFIFLVFFFRKSNFQNVPHGMNRNVNLKRI